MDPWGLVISWKTLCSTFCFVFKNVENVIATIQITFFLFYYSLTNAAPVSVKCLEYMSLSHWLNDRLHSCDNDLQYISQYHKISAIQMDFDSIDREYKMHLPSVVQE